ncbi:MAG TPA: lytic transglycosylase domain-containing protein [Vicinamibacterales bacterium]|nr:lytic transglycosylase domain-containing protein [Vicinamibacterales bacterium]
MFRILCLAVIAATLAPTRADAQIYAWRDGHGTLVLSDRTINAPTDVYVVEGAPAYRTTRPANGTAVGAEYESLIDDYAAMRSLRPELVRAVIQVETGFDARTTSPKGAMGLMQLMPDTARELGVQHPYDPAENIRGGTAYLRQLLDRYDGNEELALAAYNAGAGAVDRYGRQIPPYQETRDYVRKVGSRLGRKPAVSLASGKRVVYKTIEIVDGRAVPRYSTERPASGDYEVVR